MAALAANHLVRSHMQHNRKTTTEEPSGVSSTAATVNSAPAMRKNSSMPDLST